MRYLKQILTVISLCGISVFAQSSDDILTDLSVPSVNGGMIIMQQDTLLTGLIELQKEFNATTSGIEGFRVMLYRGSDMKSARKESEDVKAMFLEKYPNDVVYHEFQQPVWKVLIGDFKTYGEALKMKNQLEIDLVQIKEDIYIVPARVKF